MNSVCKNCQQAFAITPDDVSFYERIQVPPPTLCPECRMQRRWAWRNERTLHRATCAATGKSLISGFHPDAGYTIYERDYWWSDSWDPTSFGQDYDFSKPFFTQFDELMHRVPHPAVFNSRTTNCNYTQHTGEYKDGYLVSASWEGENVAYASRCNHAKDCMDVFEVFSCTLAYEDVSCFRLYNTHFSYRSESCNDSWFLFDCKSCNDCFGCWNLRGKSHHIFNQPYSKEEYKKKIKEMNLGSYAGLEKAKVEFEKIKSDALHKYAMFINAVDSTGDNLENVKNCKNCFVFADDARDCKYCMNGGFKINDSYDGFGIGASAELMYEAFDSGVQGSRQLFVGIVYGGNDVTYSYNCTGSSNIFGCIGLRSKQYCIFNKQFSKEEFEKLRAQIIDDMTKRGEYGEFFPIVISPLGYNETVAQDYFPLTKEQAIAKGYKWRDPEPSKHQITMPFEQIPDHINDTGESILKEILGCKSCGKPYRIIPRELEFLKRFGIALPRKCFECRHMERFHQVNFPRLYHRTCMHEGCDNTFETTYAPDRPEKVYCERCYLSSVA